MRCAPRKWACPTCGRLGRRKRKRTRKVRSLCYQEELWLKIEYGEYVAKCDCRKSFHSHPPGVELKAKYDDKVRQAVVDRIVQDKLNLSSVQAAMQRDFLLNLSTGFIYDTLDWAIRRFDGNAFRRRVLKEFSGVMCVDEIHFGRRVLLLASDPNSDNPLAAALVSRNDCEHMRRFLENLKNHGFSPKTVVTDRSQLYPSTIAAVWPQAKHQLCIFHVIAEINKLVLDGVRDCRRSLKPKRIKKGRGRPSKRQRARVRKLQAQRRRADALFRHRHLIVQKRAKLSARQRKKLDELLALSPTLKTLRKFADDIYALFSLRRSQRQAMRIWRRMRRMRKYLAIGPLAKALEILTKDNMRKLLVYLDEPLSARTATRTNNHVERCNRTLRYLEKVRYKWRRSRTIIRHILLQFQNWLSVRENKTLSTT